MGSVPLLDGTGEVHLELRVGVPEVWGHPIPWSYLANAEKAGNMDMGLQTFELHGLSEEPGLTVSSMLYVPVPSSLPPCCQCP